MSDATRRPGRFWLPDTGQRVRDRDEGDELVVVRTHPGSAAGSFRLHHLGETVADLNPEYDPSAPVVEAVYAEAADEAAPRWRTAADLRAACARTDLSAYAFPTDRLAPVEEAEP